MSSKFFSHAQVQIAQTNCANSSPTLSSTNCTDVPTSWDQMPNIAPTLTRYKCLELTCSLVMMGVLQNAHKILLIGCKTWCTRNTGYHGNIVDVHYSRCSVYSIHMAWPHGTETRLWPLVARWGKSQGVQCRVYSPNRQHHQEGDVLTTWKPYRLLTSIGEFHIQHYWY